MKKALLTLAIVATSMIGACATGPSADELIAQAEAEIKVTKGMENLWRDTESMLEDAKKALASGDKSTASQLAKKALSEAKLAQQQAKDNADAGPKYK